MFIELLQKEQAAYEAKIIQITAGGELSVPKEIVSSVGFSSLDPQEQVMSK